MQRYVFRGATQLLQLILLGVFCLANSALAVTVSGTIRDANGIPLVWAEVIVSYGAQEARAFTTLSGSYSIDGVPTGQPLTIVATKAGHTPDSTNVTLSGNYVYSPSLSGRTFTLGGIVIDTDLNPVAGVEVDLSNGESTITGPDGIFSFAVEYGETVDLYVYEQDHHFHNSDMVITVRGDEIRTIVGELN